ncbi:MAG: bifunctional glutamine synthetase adenylyltransferase/deadenyltransferase, partial [Candidatus Thiodiazotropha sp. (ex Semelilucina semeliformis)]|nr:bifunctional glutamine synthetase adenylyltransferase/deadenyltransferase [Candidatus Thiodiazotropha sp. (ex Semelilucina semeliformis)]
MRRALDLQNETEKQWQQWGEKLTDAGLDLPESEVFQQTLMRVWEASDYVAQACLRYPSLLLTLYQAGELDRNYAENELSAKLALQLESVADEAALSVCLRQFRREQMVRIIWRDIGGLAPLDETLEDLSALADACIDQALALLYEWTCRDMGTPRNAEGEAQPLVVLGMGKLGARELNLSSDIDLIFAYPESGQTDGPRRLTNEQFFIRLCQRLVQALDNHTAEGF